MSAPAGIPDPREQSRSGSRSPRGDFDFNQDPRIRQAGSDHGRGWPDRPEVLSKGRPALRELRAINEDVGHTHDVVEGRAGLRQGAGDVPEALLRLLVESRRPRHEHPLAVDNGPRESNLTLEGGP